MTHHILPNLAKQNWPGGGSAVECSCRLVLCLWRYGSAKSLRFLFRKKSLTQFWLKWRSPRVVLDSYFRANSTLTHVSIQMIRLWLNSHFTLLFLIDLTPTQLKSQICLPDSTPTQLIWVRVESNLTHYSWVEHNPGFDLSLLCRLIRSLLKFIFTRRDISKYKRSRDSQQRTTNSCNKCRAGTREPGGGGGAVGQLAPTTLKLWGRAPPPELWTEKVVHFYFCLFLHVNLGLQQKILGQIRGVFSFG